jgi:hypothetical protein
VLEAGSGKSPPEEQHVIFVVLSNQYKLLALRHLSKTIAKKIAYCNRAGRVSCQESAL